MDTSTEEFIKNVDYIHLGQYSVQWPSFVKERASFWYHKCEGLHGHISYRGGHCAWSLVIKLVGWLIILLLSYFQSSFGHNTDKTLITNEFRDSTSR